MRQKVTRTLGIKHYQGENPPSGVLIDIFFKKRPDAEPAISITDAEGKTIRDFKLTMEPGLQRLVWNFQPTKTPAASFPP